MLLVIWDYQERGVRVVAVGTEHGVSVLVTSGHRRVLIESGAAGEALADGLETHLTPLHRDIDLTVSDARNRNDPFSTGHGSDQRWSLRTSPTDGSKTLGTSTTVSMPNDVSIEILMEPGHVDEARGLVASVRRGSAVVVIASGTSRWVTAAVSQRDAGVVIAAVDRSAEAGTLQGAPLLLVPAEDVDRTSPSAVGSTVVRVFPGQSMVFRLHELGVELPDSLDRRLGQRAATPSASSRPLGGTRASNSRRMSVRSSSDRRTSRPARAIAFATRTALA